MRSEIAPSKSEDATFLALKITAYCSEIARASNEPEHLPGLSAYAIELSLAPDRRTLRALSKEVDVWLREAHPAPLSLLVVAAMRSKGVPDRLLPVLPSAKRLQSIATRGAIRTPLEASLVHSVLANPELSAQLSQQVPLLGAVLDRWHATAATEA